LVPFSQLHTPAGHLCGEAASALQKEIRRGHEQEALYWASELDLAGFGAYVWKRLRIIASEDVGLADPIVVVTVRALYDNWLEQRKADKGEGLNAAIFLVHAVILLARVPKSRIVDHALIVMYEGERPALEMPDHALDKHTARGRKMGRGFDHFFDVAAQLANEAGLPDPYEADARDVCIRNERKRRAPASR